MKATAKYVAEMQVGIAQNVRFHWKWFQPDSTTCGSVKTKYHPWNYLTLILNIFSLEHIQFSEPSGYQDARQNIPYL
jgi:hypothetical protein